ncbi:S-methyl-5'-thioadenosine phosphorylase-like [Brevipalpus obovatus]|uniref:S-methyl-5'-thioadenosine phosphorylase-like n=1 Tax=Brevipalpus obovatus TaxID=246614 RepID=UPI003D9E41C7
MGKIKIGIIGGTGLDANVDIIKEPDKIDVPATPYGNPSDSQVTVGKIHGIDIVIMSRHGKNHDVNPSKVNYRANIWTFKQLGCTHVLATTACGSLQQHVKPLSFAIPDQYIDRTHGRESTLYKVIHIPQAEPFDRTMQGMIEKACKINNFECTPKATVVICEGPRYSTVAESNLFRSWNCDVVNMTACPEVSLASEAGLIYASIAMVTDYDCWNQDETSVSVAEVDKMMAKIKSKIQVLLPEVIRLMGEHDWSDAIKRKNTEAKEAIMTP